MTLISRSHRLLIALALCLITTMACAQVVAVVSAKNPVSVLKKEQVADIFLGRTNRFPDGSEAIPIDQPEGTTVRDKFYLKYTGKSPAQIKAYWARIIFTGRGEPPEEIANSAELKKLISNNPHIIGYIDKSQVDNSVKVLHVK